MTHFFFFSKKVNSPKFAYGQNHNPKKKGKKYSKVQNNERDQTIISVRNYADPKQFQVSKLTKEKKKKTQNRIRLFGSRNSGINVATGDAALAAAQRLAADVSCSAHRSYGHHFRRRL